MAYYGQYAIPQQTSVQQFYQAYPPSAGLASYGGASAYRMSSQPNYYNGPTYSTTSESENFGSNLPVAGYGNSGYNTGYQGYGANIGSYGAQTYTTDAYGYNQPSAYPRNEDMTPQIEAAYEAATSQRRQPVIKRQVITVPGAPGKVQQIVRRLPTPTPDIVERVFVVKPQRDVVNLVIERPGTPPAQYKDRTIIGKPRKPLINPLVVRVASRSYPSSHQQQFVQALPAPTSNTADPTMSYTYQAQPTSSQAQQTLSRQYQTNLSETRLSQGSHTQLNQQQNFVVAPVQYDDSQQPDQQQQALSAQYNYSSVYPTQQQTQNGYGSTGYSASYQNQYQPSPYQFGRAY